MERVLLLTSTVSPKDNPFVGTMEQRRIEYIRAIKWYLKNTPYKIVIVDNSNYDFSLDIRDTRLDTFRFDAPFQNKGKGYGELGIIDYGLSHSKSLKFASQIIKITGRHIVTNIMELLDECNDVDAVYEDSNLWLKQAYTYFIVAPKSFYISLIKYRNFLNDRGGYLEHITAIELVDWQWVKRPYHTFLHPIFIKGHSGVSNTEYKRPKLNKKIRISFKWLVNECRFLLIKNHILNKQAIFDRIKPI